MNGGELIADVLARHGVRQLFTLCGGHISPILVAAKRSGISVIDVRHEADAVFAADAVARLTGIPGVAAVTAGPGATNTITAVKNAQLAQSPVLLLGGATATVLEGRGSLQDIDQMALFEPHVKWATSVRRVRHLASTVAEALAIAQHGVPGPVFVECPVDLLYPEETVVEWYGMKGGGSGLAGKLLAAYLRFHTWRLFRGADRSVLSERVPPPAPALPETGAVKRTAARLAKAERPVLVVGSQAMLEAQDADEIAHAVKHLGIPVYLTGMARGLLGRHHSLQVRHRRRDALKQADVVILAGVPFDFRMDYGRQIGRQTWIASANRHRDELARNRRPDLPVLADPGRFLRLLAQAIPGGTAERIAPWIDTLRDRDAVRDEEIAEMAAAPAPGGVNPLLVCQEIEQALADDSILVADGGDFVATASYVVRPRRPLSWLDPGVFGTLGVGGGFAAGARLSRPASEVWILWGDGSAAYSLAELDTFVRHGIPVIAVVGNDASWAQIARDQVEVLGDEVGTVLRRTDYHRVAEGWGGKGLLVRAPEEVRPALAEAKRLAAAGHPVLVNVHLGRSSFRKGSISM